MQLSVVSTCCACGPPCKTLQSDLDCDEVYHSDVDTQVKANASIVQQNVPPLLVALFESLEDLCCDDAAADPQMNCTFLRNKLINNRSVILVNVLSKGRYRLPLLFLGTCSHRLLTLAIM